jgi:hypothetical protein
MAKSGLLNLSRILRDNPSTYVPVTRLWGLWTLPWNRPGLPLLAWTFFRIRNHQTKR